MVRRQSGAGDDLRNDHGLRGRGTTPPPPATPTSAATSSAQTALDREYAGPEQALGLTHGDTAAQLLERIPSLAADIQARAGCFGLATLYNDFPCTFCEAKAADSYAGPRDTALSARPLIVNTTHDPSTPIQNAEEMAGLLRVRSSRWSTATLTPRC